MDDELRERRVEASVCERQSLGRRLRDVATLLILTYRSDELEADHPLRRVLGELPASNTRRLAIERLSAAAVRALAARGGAHLAGAHRAV